MSVKSRKKLAQETEEHILEYLRQREEPVSFYTLYKELNFSSGKAQSALRRLESEELVHVRKKISKFQTFIYHEPFEIEPKIIKNLEEEIMIFPFGINYMVGSILKQVPKLTDEYSSFMDLVSKAIGYFFKEKLPYDLRKKAILQAVEKGKIPEELGKQILGE